MIEKLHKITSFENKMVEPIIIASNQIEKLVHGLLNVFHLLNGKHTYSTYQL
jgi:hypothetical protein